ncbi:GNAT family N-acetyltransferase [Methylobacterium nodulans]|uniref:Protein involved in cellulose biosynthesis (CelD)-like protein n=1 Tax=Methylobacterium nodulans (strain LMG 21967 / CNCM I-2342 / ORS 2060) TaxID=460265 RepID=B8IGC4_METNO|nr:GNAT family N-acetyltransferase [Methylobacterium nodulans]ACL61601.1 Protein involved in cellulose biosynthesis (CelD)-like protein [Methylobacterium nodulans ORS 2060]
MPEIEYKFYGDFSDIPTLETVWKAVESPHVFQTYEFVSSWFSITHHCQHPAVVIGYERGVPFGILPACVIKRNQFRILSWAPVPLVLDYGDILFNTDAPIRPEEFMRRAIDLAKESASCRTTAFYHVREDATCYPFLQQRFLLASRTIAPYLVAGQPFEATLRKVREARSNQKANCERNIKRLKEMGQLNLTIYRESSDDAERALAFIFKHKKKQFSRTKIMIDYTDYKNWYIRQIRENRDAFVACLTLNGLPIAGLFGFFWQERLYYLVPAYDVELSKYAPGRVLFYLLIKQYSEDIKIFDLGIGDESYKLQWTIQSCDVFSFIEPTIIGWIAYNSTRAIAFATSQIARLKSL